MAPFHCGRMFMHCLLAVTLVVTPALSSALAAPTEPHAAPSSIGLSTLRGGQEVVPTPGPTAAPDSGSNASSALKRKDLAPGGVGAVMWFGSGGDDSSDCVLEAGGRAAQPGGALDCSLQIARPSVLYLESFRGAQYVQLRVT